MLLFPALCPSAELSEPGAKWQPIGSYECHGQVEPKTASGDHLCGVDASPGHRVCLSSNLIDNEGKNFSEYTWQFRLPPVGGVLWTSSSFEFPLFLLSPALGIFGHSLLKIWWVCNDISLWLFSFGGLCWVFVPACRLSQVAENGGYSLLVVWGLLIKWLRLLQSTGFRAVGFSCCVTKA